MRAPIYDFLKKYAEDAPLRLHMPGHKGSGPLGAEALDITEVCGADSLYEASGIIAESESIAGELFGAHTFYSAEGSSLSIRAMVYLSTLYAKERGERPLILAGRNAHKSFLSAVALTDAEVEWLDGEQGLGYLSCSLDPLWLAGRLDCAPRPTAVYITCPDYLGRSVDISAISRICHERGVLLLVDNAHGAYLKFLSPSRHPMDLGADMCSDSAHKTLPVLTGGGYLHISKNAPDTLRRGAKEAMALFGSTSPSYLILCSLDLCNRALSEGLDEEIAACCASLSEMKERLAEGGFVTTGDEPMKLTLNAAAYGYSGTELSAILTEAGISPEFADGEYLVLMPAPGNGGELSRLADVLLSIPKRDPIKNTAPALPKAERAVSVREAMLSPALWLPTEEAVGRIVARPGLSCPPAVSVLMPGERVSLPAVDCLRFYGIEKICVIN